MRERQRSLSRLSGSGNGLRKRPTSCSPDGGHDTQLTLVFPPLSTYASVPTHMKTPPDPHFSISRTAQIRPTARMLLGLSRLSRVPIAPCPQSMATRLSFCSARIHPNRHFSLQPSLVSPPALLIPAQIRRRVRTPLCPPQLSLRPAWPVRTWIVHTKVSLLLAWLDYVIVSFS
jgi:hypothetical protein